MKIVIAMSGGVDSSAAALILKNEGHEIIGVTMKLWDCFKNPSRQTCCSAADAMDARRVCEQLAIPHHVIDMRNAFRSEVVEYFAAEYSKGRTPNPCIKCNEALKFNLLRKECSALFGTDILATGHYARITGGKLFEGIDKNKDQSYFLFGLKKEDLARTIFPLGELTKSEVRKIASNAGLKTAAKHESQEICFIPDNDYAGFLADYFPELLKKPGNFVDTEGNVLGRHEGIHAYTIGQRRGIGFGLGKRQYVVRIDAVKNEVVLGNNSDLFRRELIAEDVNWIHEPFCTSEVTPPRCMSVNAKVKIRYRSSGAPAKITALDNNSVRIEFEAPQRAITPGQAAVFYNGDELIGGGWIAA